MCLKKRRGSGSGNQGDCMDIQIRQPVGDAIREGRGVVGLESVIFTHGLPSIHGPNAALDAEDEIQSAGAVPATCAISGGTAIIGLTGDEINDLSNHPPPKANSSSMIAAMGLGKNAALTAGATARLCHAAGIRVVATGGIGGVHDEDGFDISSDLHVLATCPLIVVCSGPKIILDIVNTFELLETLEIVVVGYRCSTAPGFYVRNSGIKVDHTAETVDDLVAIWRTGMDLNHPASVLVLNPPPEEHAFKQSEIDEIMMKIKSDALGAVSGKNVTPVVLSRLQEELGPSSITLNRALLRSNARLAGEISVSLAS